MKIFSSVSWLSITLLTLSSLVVIAEILRSRQYPQWHVRNGLPHILWQLIIIFSICLLFVGVVRFCADKKIVYWGIAFLVFSVGSLAGLLTLYPLDTLTEPFDVAILKNDGTRKVVARKCYNSKTNAEIMDTVIVKDVYLFRKIE